MLKPRANAECARLSQPHTVSDPPPQNYEEVHRSHSLSQIRNWRRRRPSARRTLGGHGVLPRHSPHHPHPVLGDFPSMRDNRPEVGYTDFTDVHRCSQIRRLFTAWLPSDYCPLTSVEICEICLRNLGLEQAGMSRKILGPHAVGAGVAAGEWSSGQGRQQRSAWRESSTMHPETAHIIAAGLSSARTLHWGWAHRKLAPR